jgi:predicted benzoate:H+ symporter BenE
VIKKALRLLRDATVLITGGRIAAVEGALADEPRLGAISADNFVQPTYTAMEVINISTSGAM